MDPSFGLVDDHHFHANDPRLRSSRSSPKLLALRGVKPTNLPRKLMGLEVAVPSLPRPTLKEEMMEAPNLPML